MPVSMRVQLAPLLLLLVLLLVVAQDKEQQAVLLQSPTLQLHQLPTGSN